MIIHDYCFKGDIQHAIETHELLYQIFQKYGQIPEAFTHRFDIHWGQYRLRPEFAESTYLLYKGTRLLNVRAMTRQYYPPLTLHY